MPAPFWLDVEMVEGEPRVLDTALATQVGYENARQIRELIERNRWELEGHGSLSCRTTNPGPKGGRPSTAFYLNRQQALLICILAKTPKAREVRAEVIRRFDAYEAPAAPGTAHPSLGMDQLIGVVSALALTVQGFIHAVAAKAVSGA